MTNAEMKRHCYNVLMDALIEDLLSNKDIRFWTGTCIREGMFKKVAVLLEDLGSSALPSLMEAITSIQRGRTT